MVRTGESPYLMPLKMTDVQMNITGFIADVTVEQTFYNPDSESIEAVYVFPLPGDVAVNDMQVHVGCRVIRSLVKKREEAAQMYAQARNEDDTVLCLNRNEPMSLPRQ